MAHYLWPPKWLGSAPRWADDPTLAIDPADLADVVAEGSLPPAIRFRAYRDGMLAFDLGSWGDPVRLSDASTENFEAVAEYQVRCARLMNAHLACIHTAGSAGAKPTVLTPDRVMSVRWTDGRFQSGGAAMAMSFELWRARGQGLSSTDWRLVGRHEVISTEAINDSIELLRALLERPEQGTVLLRAELIYRSAAAYSDHDASAALVHAWTAAEGLLGDLLANYLDSRDDLNHERKRYLKSSNVNARVTAEILSLAGRLPAALYEGIERARKRRNRWLHSQERVTSEDAERAIQTAQQLFELVEGVRLQMPLGRQLHSLG